MADLVTRIREAAEAGHDHLYVADVPERVPKGVEIVRPFCYCFRPGARVKLLLRGSDEFRVIYQDVQDKELADELDAWMLKQQMDYDNLAATIQALRDLIRELDTLLNEGGHIIRVFYRDTDRLNPPGVQVRDGNTIYFRALPFMLVRDAIREIRKRYRQSPVFTVVVGNASDSFTLRASST